MNLSKEYWSNKYLENSAKWDLGSISPPLKEYINQLPNKDIKILIPGSGNSYEAEYLYKQGFKNVFVLDFAKEPLLNFKKRIPTFPDDHLLNKDFFELEIQFDLILEQTFFCALDPELREAYVTQMNKLLKPDGKLVGVLFNFKLTKFGPPYGGDLNSYKNLFEGLFTIQKLEDCYNSIPPRAGNELFFIFKKNN